MLVSEWFRRYMHLSQTVWSGLQYSFLSEDNKQVGPFVYCKEFLLDNTWSTVNKRPFFIYGYDYNPSDDPKVCLSECRILVRNVTDPLFPKRVGNMIKFLNAFEEKMGYTKSRFETCENSRAATILLISDAKWMHAPPLLSLLTLLIRVGMIYDGKKNFEDHCKNVCKGNVKPYQYRDNDHLKKSWTTIKAILNSETNLFKFHEDTNANWPEDVKPYMVHECGGIVSLAGGYAMCKNWYVKKEADCVGTK